MIKNFDPSFLGNNFSMFVILVKGSIKFNKQLYDFQVKIDIPKNVHDWMTRNRTLNGLYVADYDFHKLTIDHIGIDYPCENYVSLVEDYYEDDSEDHCEDYCEDESEDKSEDKNEHRDEDHCEDESEHRDEDHCDDHCEDESEDDHILENVMLELSTMTINTIDACHIHCNGKKVCGCGCDKNHNGGGGRCDPYPSTYSKLFIISNDT